MTKPLNKSIEQMEAEGDYVIYDGCKYYNKAYWTREKFERHTERCRKIDSGEITSKRYTYDEYIKYFNTIIDDKNRGLYQDPETAPQLRG